MGGGTGRVRDIAILVIETFALKNFRSQERKSNGTFVLGNKNDVELSLSIRIHTRNTEVISDAKW